MLDPDPDRRSVALAGPLGGGDDRAGQAPHPAQYHPPVQFGVIDWRCPVEVFPHNAFHLYDDAAAIVTIRDGTAIINDNARLADYHSLFDELAVLASFGDATQDILRQIADDYRTLEQHRG